MDIPTNYEDKFRPAAVQKTAAPRCERDELLDRFVAKVNAGRVADGFSKVSAARMAKMLAGRTDSQLHQLYKECDDPSVRRFGAMLNYKLTCTHRS